MSHLEDRIHRTEEVQEIMGAMPHWLLRWGTAMVWMLVMTLIGVAVYIKYPDSISGEITVTCPTPPASVISRSTGRIQLFAKDGEAVKKDQTIGLIENTAVYDEVMALTGQMSELEQLVESPIKLLGQTKALPNYYQLGVLEDVYNRFKNNCEEYILFMELRQNTQKIKSFSQLGSILREEDEVLKEKLLVSRREVAMAQKRLTADSALYQQQALSAMELNQSEQVYMSALNRMHAIKENILKNQEQLTRVNSSSNDLSLTDRGEKLMLERKMQMTFKELKTQINFWNQQYVIKAPMDGKLSLFDVWNSNQIVSQGDEVANVIAGGDNAFAKLKVTGNKFGKVKKGQKVKVILDSYPSSEYGIVFAEVASISAINRDNIYIINATFPEGLVTTRGDKVPFRHEMKGVGEILTDDLNLLQRVFYQFKDLFLKSDKVKV